MRTAPRFTLLLLLPLVAACDRDRLVIRGSLNGEEGSCPEATVSRVFVREGSDTAAVRGCRFRLAVADSGDLVLGFGDELEAEAWMHLARVPARARIGLARIAFDDRGLAYPASVELNGAEAIEINGLRVADAGALPSRIDVEAVVLGVDSRRGLLLARPDDESLPDLRVRLDSAAEVRTTAGEPGRLSNLQFGTAVRVVGATRDGFVIAGRIVVPAPAPPGRRGGDDRSSGGVWDEVERILRILGFPVDR